MEDAAERTGTGTEAEAAGDVMALGELWLERELGDTARDVVCSPVGLWRALGDDAGGGGELSGTVGDAAGDVVGVEARWEWPFVPYFTREIPFTDAQGRTAGVAAMIGEVPVEDAWVVERPHGRVTVLELRAESGGQPVKVRFALGESRQVPPLDVALASWQPVGRKVRHSRGGGGRNPEAMLLELPRLALSCEWDVASVLGELGVAGFSEPLPEALPETLSEPFPGPRYGHRAVQRCRVRIDEDGISSAATPPVPVDPDDRSWPGEWTDGPGALVRTAPMRLDRPFAFSVLDGSGTIPLLAGYQAGRPDPARF